VKLCEGKENGSRETCNEIQNVKPLEKIKLIINSNEKGNEATDKPEPVKENSQIREIHIFKPRATLDLARIAKNIQEIREKLGII
jgi:hypothetical protein